MGVDAALWKYEVITHNAGSGHRPECHTWCFRALHLLSLAAAGNLSRLYVSFTAAPPTGPSLWVCGPPRIDAILSPRHTVEKRCMKSQCIFNKTKKSHTLIREVKGGGTKTGRNTHSDHGHIRRDILLICDGLSQLYSDLRERAGVRQNLYWDVKS